jgi:hypothetical protein
MRQIPMLTTVGQNQRTLEWEFSDPYIVWFAPPLSTSEFRAAFFYSVIEFAVSWGGARF